MSHIVLDTNCLIQALPPKSKYHIIWQRIQEGEDTLYVSNLILNEYEEILQQLAGEETAKAVIQFILNSSNIRLITPSYKFNLITADPDDNKFVDCAVAANAKCIVSNDRHFDVLKTIDFPKVDVLNIEEYYILIC